MNTRKRTRQTTEREQNVALKMTKCKRPTRTDTQAADEPKIDLSTRTMNTAECEMVASSIDPVDDDSIELNSHSNSAGNSSDDIMSATDDLLREADILMAEIAEFRRENSSEEAQTNDDVAVIESDAVHQTSSNSETARASTSANGNQSASAIDDSIVLIEDIPHPGPVRPIVRNDDDEDVIFVTETRQRQRTIATIDLCDTPDNSFSSTRNERKSTEKPPPPMASASPEKPAGSRIGTTKCPICLEMYTMDEILSTMCGHLYCEPCIRNVIKTRKKCPMCNRALKPNQVHRIFLDH